MKTNLKMIIGITAIFAVLSLTGCGSVIAAATEQTLVDQTMNVPAGSVFYTNFTLNSTATVDVKVNVTSGDGVKIYLVDNANLSKLRNNSQFQYYVGLSADYKVTSYTKSGTLTAGTWNIAVVNPNALLSQTVKAKITAHK